MLFCDIDHFKKINDTFGHDAGDIALRRFTETVAEALGEHGQLGRLGGEEFAALLPGADRTGAEALAEQVRQRVEKMVVNADDTTQFSFTISIGASCLRSGDGEASMMARADEALYRAKNSGRNRVIFDD